MREQKGGQSVAAAGALLVALLVVGLGFFLGDAPEGSSAQTRAASSRPRKAAPAPSSPEARTRVPPQTGSDGVLEVEVLSGDKPPPGAEVQVYAREPADLRSFPSRWIPWSKGETEPDGRWVLPAPPGSYFVTARVEKLAPASAAVVHRPGAGRTFVRLRLKGGEALLGSIVERGTSTPVSLAEIILTPHGFTADPQGRLDAPEEESLFTTSSETGEFQFTGLAPGRYRATARAPGYVSGVLPSVPIPFKGRILFELVPGGWLEGVVLRQDGQPVAGAEVLAHNPRDDATGFTDSKGYFSLEVPPGAYSVSARAGQEAGALEQEVKAARGQRVQGLRIQLGAGARVSGKVLRKDGTPVLGARVELRPRGSESLSGLAGTDSSGSFSISPLAAGTYDVKVLMSAQAWMGSASIPVEDSPITLAAGEHREMTITQEPTGNIQCSVREGFRGLEGILIRASPLHLQDSTRGRVVETRTNRLGAFRFDGLPPGVFHLELRRDSSSAPIREEFLLVQEGRTTPCGAEGLAVPASEDAWSIVEGRVVGRSGALPATPVLLKASSQRKPSLTSTSLIDAQGRFRLVLPPGKYFVSTLLHWSEGCELLGQRQLQVEPGHHPDTPIVVEEAPGSYRRLQVLGPDGTPLRRTLVQVSIAGARRTVAQTDESGHVELCHSGDGSSPGPWISVSSLDNALTAAITPAIGQRDLTLTLRPAPSIQGRVIHTGGAPVTRIFLELLFQNRRGDDSPELTFLGDQFEVRGLPPGPTQLLVTTDDGSKGSLLLELRNEEHARVEIPVSPVPR